MSSFFNNEEQKMRAYKANLKKEASNQFKQGEKLQDYLLYQKGIETQETGLNKFAEAIGQKVGENVNVVGKIDKLKKIETLPANMLVDEFGVSIKNRNKGPKSIKQPPKPKAMKQNNIPLENFKMGLEDDRAFENNKKSVVKDLNKRFATEEAQAALNNSNTVIDVADDANQLLYDLMKYSAGDVSIDVDGLIEYLDELSAKEDAKVRQTFMNVLDEMADKTKVKKDLAILNRLQDLIERQRMADAFQKFSENAITDEFAKKIQRNLKAAMENKKTMRAVRAGVEQKKLANQMEREYQDMFNTASAQEKIVGRKVNKMPLAKKSLSISERMAELRALKAEKKRAMSDASDATYPMSLAGEKVDNRHFNVGAAKKDTNKELNEFTNLLIDFDQSSGDNRKKINDKLRNIISRQNKVNRQIAERMKTLKSALRK